jgi:hypothetical protein
MAVKYVCKEINDVILSHVCFKKNFYNLIERTENLCLHTVTAKDCIVMRGGWGTA